MQLMAMAISIATPARIRVRIPSPDQSECSVKTVYRPIHIALLINKVAYATQMMIIDRELNCVVMDGDNRGRQKNRREQ